MALDVITAISTFRICPIDAPWPNIYGALTPQGSWGGTTAANATGCTLIAGYKGGGLGITAPPFNHNINGAVTPTCYAIGQSEDLLSAQTISGNVTVTIMAQESDAAANMFLRVYLWVKVAGTASTVRGVLLNTTAAGEFSTTAMGLSSGSLALTPLAVQSGDVLVLEIGTANVVNAAFNGKLWFSGGALSDGTFVADMSAGSTTNTLGTTVVFDTPVSMHQYVPEAGDVLGGNTRLFLYDGTTGALKREVIPPGAAAISGGQTQSDGTILLAADKGFAYAPSWLWRYNADLSFDSFVDIGTDGINPHSLARDALGRSYIGYVGDNGTGCGEDGDVGPPAPPSYYVRRVTSTGTLDASYAIAIDLGGSQAVDLAADQSTLFYTSLGRKIKRYDVSSSVQMADFAVLPAAADDEVARGIVILPDGGLILADGLNLKRLNSAGTVTQTYTLPASEPDVFLGTFPSSYATFYTDFTTTFGSYGDWGVVALSADGSKVWSANRSDYNDNLYGTLARWDVETGTCEVVITQGWVLPTGGGFCSGGLVVYGGYRAGTTGVPSFINGPQALEFFEGNGLLKAFDVPRVRVVPHLADENQRLFYSKFQLDCECGSGLVTGQGVDPVILLRYSDDGGFTWSSWRQLTTGALGVYRWRCIAWRLGMARDRVFMIRQTDPVKSAWLTAYIDFEGADA